MTLVEMPRLACAAILGGALAAGCSSDSLRFQSPDFPPEGTSIAALTQPQAKALCQWLPTLAGYPPLPDDEASDGYPVPASGYVNDSQGGGGCVDPSTYRLLYYIRVGIADCERNLRHSPCDATVGALQSCLTYVGDALEGKRGFTCSGAETACASLYARPGCDETVLQHSFIVPNGVMSADCYSLPISSDAIPPPDCERFEP
jgi:hypothetical protein